MNAGTRVIFMLSFAVIVGSDVSCTSSPGEDTRPDPSARAARRVQPETVHAPAAPISSPPQPPVSLQQQNFTQQTDSQPEQPKQDPVQAAKEIATNYMNAHARELLVDPNSQVDSYEITDVVKSDSLMWPYKVAVGMHCSSSNLGRTYEEIIISVNLDTGQAVADLANG